MSLDVHLLEEIDLLHLYNLRSNQKGLKIHHDANPKRVDAAQRLFDKGLLSQRDGGYLTDRGIETAEHLQRVLAMLNPSAD